MALLLGLILIPFFLFGAAIEARTEALAAGAQRVIALGGASLLALDIVLPVPSSLLATAIGPRWDPGRERGQRAGLTLGCAAGSCSAARVRRWPAGSLGSPCTGASRRPRRGTASC